jgi:methionine-rich copper-binding protein CopC
MLSGRTSSSSAPTRTSVTLALARATSPDSLDAEATELGLGRYRLCWQVLAIGGHITPGDIPFEIAP